MEQTERLKQAVIDYRAGRQEAFTGLYEESGRYIYASIYKVVGGTDNVQDVVCDIMQDTYVEISRSISQLEDVDRFLPWAGTIASRKCYAWLKKNKRYVLLREEDETFENLADDDSIIPEEVIQDREKQRLIREIIYTQLTDIQKLCIVAFYYNEQKLSEIAEQFGIPENTVKTNLSRARAKIKAGVVGVEKKQGIKLYSLAPLLLFMFSEDVSACTVPAQITEKVTASVAADTAAAAGGMSAASKIGGKKLSGKLVAVSVKAKIAAVIAGIGVLGALAGGIIYVAGQDRDRGDVWAVEDSDEDYTEEKAESREKTADDTENTEEETVEEELLLPEDLEQEPQETKTTLTEADEKKLKTLVGLAVMTDYFLGERMSGEFYHAKDLAVNMRFIEMVSLFSITDDNLEAMYADYTPEMEVKRDTFERYFEVEEIRSYLKNVFKMEDADLTGYMQGDRVLCSLVSDPAFAEVNFGEALAVSGGAYKISGTAAVLEVESDVDYYPFILTVTPNSESPFGYTMDSLYYGTTAGIDLEDSQYEAILQMVYAAETACISHWQMTEDFNIFPEEMGILSKLNFAAAGARFGWLGEQREQADIGELAGLYNRVTGDAFFREEVDAQFAEMQAAGTYIYDGTEYEDGMVNLYVHVRTFYGEPVSTDREEIEKDGYVYENRVFSSRDGRGILKKNDTQRFFRGGNYIGLFGESMLYKVPFAVFLYEDADSPTGYRLHYIHYYIGESPLGRLG